MTTANLPLKVNPPCEKLGLEVEFPQYGVQLIRSFLNWGTK